MGRIIDAVPPTLRFGEVGGSRPLPYPLLLVGVLQAEVVGERPHGDRQLADLLQLDGPLVGADDQGVHPPVGGLGQQVDEGLEETHPQVLQILGGLHLLGVGEEDVLLWGTHGPGRGGSERARERAANVLGKFSGLSIQYFIDSSTPDKLIKA